MHGVEPIFGYSGVPQQADPIQQVERETPGVDGPEKIERDPPVGVSAPEPVAFTTPNGAADPDPFAEPARGQPAGPEPLPERENAGPQAPEYMERVGQTGSQGVDGPDGVPLYSHDRPAPMVEPVAERVGSQAPAPAPLDYPANQATPEPPGVPQYMNREPPGVVGLGESPPTGAANPEPFDTSYPAGVPEVSPPPATPEPTPFVNPARIRFRDGPATQDTFWYS